MSAPPERPAPPPRPAAPEAPPIALTLPPESGLVLVETSHKAPAPAVDEPPVERPRRVRPPRVEVASDPLEFVETRKEPPPAA